MALEDAKRQIDHAFTRPELRGLTYENAFGGAPSFLRRRYTKDLAGVDVAVTGVPFDQATTHRPGARFGPRAIREASALQPYDPPYGWGGFDPLSDFAVADAGDMAFDYADVAAFPATLEAHARGILEAGARMIALGGDHFVSLPILRAQAALHGPLGLIQFDAHSDLWVDDEPARIDHGTWTYKAVREGLIDPARSVQVGIRTECEDYLGVEVIDAPAPCTRRARPGSPRACARSLARHPATSASTSTRSIRPSRPAPARRSGAGWPAGRPRRSCATSRASRWWAATWSRSRRHTTPPGPPPWPGRMWRLELLCLICWHMKFASQGADRTENPPLDRRDRTPRGPRPRGLRPPGPQRPRALARRPARPRRAAARERRDLLSAPGDPLSSGTPEAPDLAALDAVAMAWPRTERLAGGPEEGRITWVTRSALVGFPDYTTAAVRDRPGAQGSDGGRARRLHRRATALRAL